MSKTIIIAGGSHFIGSHVVRLFVNKYPDYKIINLDILTYMGNLENLCDIEKKPNYFSEKVDITDEATFAKDRAGDDLRCAIDSSKLQNELGWKPSLQFEEGFEKTVDWCLANETWLSNVISGEYEKYYKNQYITR